jgi:hypothetical protein
MFVELQALNAHRCLLFCLCKSVTLSGNSLLPLAPVYYSVYEVFQVRLSEGKAMSQGCCYGVLRTLQTCSSCSVLKML